MESSESKNFISHVFDFEENSKNEMLNICQYAILAIIPIIIFNKSAQYLAPLPDESKGSIEITFEIIFQIFLMFILLLLIHRIVTFVPTYSGMNYKEFNVIQIILITLVFLFSFHTILSEKVNILVNRFMNYWEGNSSSKRKESMTNKKKKSEERMSSPSDNYLQPVQQINSPPQTISSETFVPLNNIANRDFQQGGQMDYIEPMAANSVLGGGSFGNANW